MKRTELKKLIREAYREVLRETRAKMSEGPERLR